MTTTMTPVTLTNLSTLHDISVETFTATFGADNTPENLAAYLEHDLSRDQLRQEIADPAARFFFIEQDGRLAGYGKLLFHDADLEIQRVYVRQAFQHQGLGRKFLEFAEQVARQHQLPKIILGVWEHNDNARAFYRVMGYHRYGAHTFDLGADHQTDFLLAKTL